jgi:hypothetical protein
VIEIDARIEHHDVDAFTARDGPHFGSPDYRQSPRNDLRLVTLQAGRDVLFPREGGEVGRPAFHDGIDRRDAGGLAQFRHFLGGEVGGESVDVGERAHAEGLVRGVRDHAHRGRVRGGGSRRDGVSLAALAEEWQRSGDGCGESQEAGECTVHVF